MSREEVLATEQAPPRVDNEEMIVWLTKLAGLETSVGYIFHEGKFAIGGYIFREDHPANVDYLSDNDALKRLLVEKYGEPREDSKDWKVGTYEARPKRWGDAVARGDVVMRTEWFLSGTVIRLGLASNKGKVKHSLTYHSNALLAEERRRRHKKNLDDL